MLTSLDEYIYRVISPLEQVGAVIDPANVAFEVDQLIDPESVSPELKTQLSIEQIKNVVRKTLAKRHDPIEKANDYVNGDQDDLFGNELQPYYPARREAQAVYIPRHELTEIDVERIVKRMTKAGESLQVHARALQAWFISKAA